MTWFLVYTKSRFEKKVEIRLQVGGFEVYCPKVKLLKNWSDRKKIVEEVLFKSYLFVKLEKHQKDEILKIYGVVKFVNFKGDYATIREAEINKIKAFLNEFDNAKIEILPIQEGDLIEIESGILMGSKAEVLNRQGRNASVFIEAIGLKLVIDLSKNLVTHTNKV